MSQAVHVFGIRHHGPGSARSLLRALVQLEPDVLLIEGPPDAQAVLQLAGAAGMRPPVALVIYPPEQPGLGAFYPFAAFSPEWNALRYALERKVPARFCDLPQAIALAERAATAAAPVERSAERPDPILWLARAAGEDDPERWWERLVEQRTHDEDVFQAVSQAMAAAREALPDFGEPAADARHEARREAWMRQTIRTAQRDGFQRIAVVCGAWHAPALEALPPPAADEALLRGLARLPVEATWIPWTNGRLTSASGYGAGVESPAWYRHLWETGGDIATWLVAAARLLRHEELDASPAQVVEAVRLAETLAALRERPQPSLAEVMDATLSVLCDGEAPRLDLVRRRLVVGEDVGALPDDVPLVPLQRDLEREARRLRLKFEAEARTLDLDLRQPVQLERSQLLHRLGLLGLDWGQPRELPSNQRGTFHELWTLQWQPELALRLIEAGVYGNTVAEAAAARALERGEQTTGLGQLAGLIERTLLAALVPAVAPLVRLLGARSAHSTDVVQMLEALPALVAALQYGDVRRTDASSLGAVTRRLAERASVGLVAACVGLDDAGAQLLAGHLREASRALALLADAALAEDWWAALARLAQQPDLPGLLAGTACRLLVDAHRLGADAAAARLRLALSRGADPSAGARWIEGFLAGAGLALATSDALFGLVDAWLVQLPEAHFVQVLPLLRRTTSTFSPAERNHLAERVRGGGLRPGAQLDAALDPERAALVDATVLAILGAEA